ncbi:MAG TPA: metallophosphoesterase, partial [Alphaproteobacteria bacterium]
MKDMQNTRMSVSRRKFLGNLGAAFVASAGTSVASVTYTSHFDSLQITQYDLSTDKVPEGFDHVEAHITDIHAGTPSVSKKKLAQIVTQVNSLTYQKKDGQRLPVDLIGIGGDILINKHYDPRTEFFHPEEIAPILGKLEAPLGVYGCLGNHDWDRMGHVLQIRHDDLTMDIWDIFKDNNIHLHENEIVSLNKDGMEFDLAILPDYKTRWNKHFDSTILKDVDKRPTIVLSH